MKKTILSAAVVAIVAVGSLLFSLQKAESAGLGSPQKVIDTGSGNHTGAISTNRLAGGAPYTNNAWVDCSNGKEVGVQITLEATTAGTSNVIFSIYKSVDGVNKEKTPFQTLTVTLTGTTSTTICTNFSVLGIPWINFYSLTNELLSSAYLTNSFVAVSVK